MKKISAVLLTFSLLVLISSASPIFGLLTDTLTISSTGNVYLPRWSDDFDMMDPRWNWAYSQGTGFLRIGTVDGYSVAEIGITDASTRFGYSDGSLFLVDRPAVGDTEIVAIEVRARFTDDNGITTPGQGSRGIGFWDAAMPEPQNIAWFFSLSPESIPQYAGWWAWVRINGVDVLKQDLIGVVDMLQWHVYRIELLESETRFLVDGNLVASCSGRPTNLQGWSNWIDNYVYTTTGLNYLDVTQDQTLYMDYARMIDLV